MFNVQKIYDRKISNIFCEFQNIYKIHHKELKINRKLMSRMQKFDIQSVKWNVKV